MMNEHKEQCLLVEWFQLQYPMYKRHLFSVPNGGFRSKAAAGKLKAEGVMPGVFDLFLMVARPGCPGMWIEMKTKGGRVSDHQKDFKAKAESQGYKAVVCYGFDDAKQAIQEYLGP